MVKYLSEPVSFMDSVGQVYYRKTVSITITMPADLLDVVWDVMTEAGSNSRSNTVCYLVHMGIVYLKMLMAQAELEEMDKRLKATRVLNETEK